jgi:hypothetical protein
MADETDDFTCLHIERHIIERKDRAKLAGNARKRQSRAGCSGLFLQLLDLISRVHA